MNKPKAEIQFPCRWEFRLIVMSDSAEKSKEGIAAIGQAANADFEISHGESSGSGKYTALRVACIVENIERARNLASQLATVDGVRFLL